MWAINATFLAVTLACLSESENKIKTNCKSWASPGQRHQPGSFWVTSRHLSASDWCAGGGACLGARERQRGYYRSPSRNCRRRSVTGAEGRVRPGRVPVWSEGVKMSVESTCLTADRTDNDSALLKPCQTFIDCLFMFIKEEGDSAQVCGRVKRDLMWGENLNIG